MQRAQTFFKRKGFLNAEGIRFRRDAQRKLRFCSSFKNGKDDSIEFFTESTKIMVLNALSWLLIFTPESMKQSALLTVPKQFLNSTETTCKKEENLRERPPEF